MPHPLGMMSGAPATWLQSVRAVAVRLPGYDPGESDLEIDGRTYRIDLAYPAVRVAIELDGREFHRSRSAFETTGLVPGTRY